MFSILVLLDLFPYFHSYADKMDFDIKDITAHSVQRGPKHKAPFSSYMLSKLKYCFIPCFNLGSQIHFNRTKPSTDK